MCCLKKQGQVNLSKSVICVIYMMWVIYWIMNLYQVVNIQQSIIVLSALYLSLA